MKKNLNYNSGVTCGIPLDAEYFDVSGIVSGADLPARGEQRVLASFQLHPQYCGVLTHFAQFTDRFALDNSQIRTPGFEWLIVQNGKPLFPYTRLELIVNPWGCNCLPVAVRLDENAKVEFILRNRSGDPFDPTLTTFAGRILGCYWYNETFGGRA